MSFPPRLARSPRDPRPAALARPPRSLRPPLSPRPPHAPTAGPAPPRPRGPAQHVKLPCSVQGRGGACDAAPYIYIYIWLRPGGLPPLPPHVDEWFLCTSVAVHIYYIYMYIYMYIYTHSYLFIYVCMYIYIVYTHRSGTRLARSCPERLSSDDPLGRGFALILGLGGFGAHSFWDTLPSI